MDRCKEIATMLFLMLARVVGVIAYFVFSLLGVIVGLAILVATESCINAVLVLTHMYIDVGSVPPVSYFILVGATLLLIGLSVVVLCVGRELFNN